MGRKQTKSGKIRLTEVAKLAGVSLRSVKRVATAVGAVADVHLHDDLGPRVPEEDLPGSFVAKPHEIETVGVIAGPHAERLQDLRHPVEQCGQLAGTLTGEFNDLTQYNRFVSGAEVALVLSFTAGSASLTIEGNVRYDGAGGMVGGTDILTEDIPIKFVRTTGGLAETAIKITTVNAVATI